MSEHLLQAHCNGVFRPEGRVSASDDVQVALQHTVLYRAVMADRSLEPVVCSELVQGDSCAYELHVGSRHKHRLRIDVHDRASVSCHGAYAHYGSVQGLMQLAGIPCVGPGVAASAVSMDKSLTKLVMDRAQIPQAAWIGVQKSKLAVHMEQIIEQIENAFSYPVFVKPAGTGSSVGVSKAADRQQLVSALRFAAEYDETILVEEFIRGAEVEVAVMGNNNPIASICGEIDSGAEFYDYEAKYVTDTSVAYIPARISETVAEQVRDYAVKAYMALGCRGLSRVDFFVTYDDERVVFNEINTLPGFTSISMYPKLFEASGVPYSQVLDRLLKYAMEERK